MMAVLFCVLGVLVAVAAHLASKGAERRAKRTYKELMGDKHVGNAPEDIWTEVRPLVGGWGCLLALLEFLKGVGILVSIGSGLCLIIVGGS
jgi:hypothetical protein